MYAPATARWMSKDPLGVEGGSANLYSYVGANPIRRTDPSGLVFGPGPLPLPPGSHTGPKSFACCTYESGGQIWSQTVGCFGNETTAQCCARKADGWFYDWQVFMPGLAGKCSPPPPPGDPCNRDWSTLFFEDCMACCLKEPWFAFGAGGTGAAGLAGNRVPKGHVKPGQYPDTSWLYPVRRCLPKHMRPTIHRVRSFAKWSGRVFIVTGVIEAGAEVGCAAYCASL